MCQSRILVVYYCKLLQRSLFLIYYLLFSPSDYLLENGNVLTSVDHVEEYLRYRYGSSSEIPNKKTNLYCIL